MNIDDSFKFEAHIKGLYSLKVHAFGRLRPLLGEQKSKLILNSIMPNFSYYPLIWLLCSKGASKEINRTHTRALKALYGNYESMFEEFLERDNTEKTYKCLS